MEYTKNIKPYMYSNAAHVNNMSTVQYIAFRK